MKTNPILKEIRATRDRLANESGGDMRQLFAMVREKSKAVRPRGEVVIPEPKSCAVVREDTAPYVSARQRHGTMLANPIIEEIWKIREDLMSEAGGDLERLFEMVREREAAAKARGVVFVPVPEHSAVLREETGKYVVKPSRPKRGD